MQKLITLIIIFFLSICFGITDLDLSNRIVIDGFSNEFTNDERVLYDSSGSLLESPEDSYWGVYNDVKQIKVTWDANFLYLAVDACSWSNNVMLLIDIYDDYGIEDMSQLDAWPRLIKFYNFKPDFFLGTWDTNDCPQFWRVEEGGSIEVHQIESSCELEEDSSGYKSFSTIDTGNLQGSMEAKISWDLLKFDNHNSIDSLKLVAVITGGEGTGDNGGDYTSSPDSAPDNLGGMTNDAFQMVVLDNYVNIIVDGDKDEEPDMNIFPQEQSTFYKKPPFETVSLQVNNVIFPNGKTFSPLREEIYFSLETNRYSKFDVQIFDLSGRYINSANDAGESLAWTWNGRNKNGNLVPFGIYILRFIADSGEASYKEAVVLIK